MSLAWITNLSAPYRWPVWQALAAREPDFRVGLLARSEPNRHWDDVLPENVRRLPLSSWQLKRGRTPLYTLRGTALAAVEASGAVVLPGWENPAAWQLLLECRARGLSTVGFYESNEHSQRHTTGVVARVRRTFFTQVGAVLTVGAASAAAVQHLGVDDDRIVTGHNTIDLETFGPATDGAPDDVRRTSFVYVGQLIERKNVLTLLSALAATPHEYTLDIVGEGPLEATTRAAVRELGLNDRVTVHGYLEPAAVARLLARMGTLVLPSTEEVYGLAPAEALASGLHAIVSDVAGIAPDLQGMAGVWITRPTMDSLAVAMRSSTLAWAGPIASPAIRQWTPDRLAQDVHTAADRAARREH